MQARTSSRPVPGGLAGLMAARAPSPGSAFLRGPDGRTTLSYGQFRDEVDRHRTALHGLGVTRGDRVAWQLRTSPAALALHVALLECGAVQVPLNPGFPPIETEALIDDAAPVLVVRDSGLPPLSGHHVTLDPDGGGSLLEEARATQPPEPELLAAADPAALLYTSGTTGRPKGALLTHGNLQHNAESLVDAWGFTSDDVLLHVLPLFHTHGLFVAAHCVLASGASMVLLPTFDVDAAVEALPRCTVMMGVPTHYTRLLSHEGFGRDSVSGARLLVSGSAPMPETLHEQVRARTGMVVLERYGMTETAMLTSNPLDGERRPGTVGLPLRDVGVRIVDERDGRVTSGDVGHVQVRGPTVFSGYWGRPEETAEAFTDDGWFRTGDLGRVDGDGYLHLVGRAKDLVITGGYNVYPRDVEAVLDELPEVQESAIVGLPDEDLGERVTAVVVAADASLDDEMVLAHLRQRLAGYQVPRRIVQVPMLPRNAMGKVDKAALRSRLGAEGR